VNNLDQFNVIVNVIGELPEIVFQNKGINVEIVEDRNTRNINGNIKQRLVSTVNDNKVHFYVLEKESYLNYPYLCDIIHNHFNQGDKILIHCQQGLIRSATLLAFYLRKFYFESIGDINSFIGLKRDSASPSSVVLSSMEKILFK